MRTPHLPSWKFITRVAAPLFLAALCSLGSSPARAGLTWEAKSVTLEATTPVLEARFPFTNTGRGAVEIHTVRTSCGCTTTALAKRRYEPGERGEIVARFDAGERVGHQEKTVSVETSDAAEPTELRLVTDIPELVRLRPGMVFWTRGEELRPKTIILEAPPAPASVKSPARLAQVRVDSSNPDMRVECRAVTPGRRYELIVHPAQTDRFVVATLHVMCRFESDVPGEKTEREWKAYATVKPAPTASR